ncbi:hypothetical protein O2W14_05720 [Modestobacter sp. VKM Ac-2986]|uniref:hypothetical protein n=1 Tax=Modestobacter sp. VKM Ac-2986 TaxID=3004140 RepID=UPI0022AA6E39|nr:hypothetical protein [Modestobacter sp. VKM Ac-2986]MCZ2828331.1 hypothetical protein [Modestobacter sp. VKM Ac-2986]
MLTGSAVLAVVVLTGLAVLQALLAAGRPYGHLAWGGQHRVLPRALRIGSAVSIGLYAVFAAVVLGAALRSPAVPGWLQVALWVLTGYFVLGVVLNGISRSRPERLVMTPVCLVLAGCCLVVALG